MKGQDSIQGDSLFIDGESARVYGLSLTRNDSQQKLGITSSIIKLQGLKVDSLFTGKLYADSLKINDPQIDYAQEQSTLNRMGALPIHIPLVILNHGRLAYQTKNTDTLNIEDFDGVFAIQDSITLRYSRFEGFHILPDQGTHRFKVAIGNNLTTDFPMHLKGYELYLKEKDRYRIVASSSLIFVHSTGMNPPEKKKEY